MPVIASSPSTFSNPSGPPGTQTLSFAIPASTTSFTGGTWSESGTTTFSGVSATDEIKTGGSHNAIWPAKMATGPFGPLTVAVTSAQLADINAIALGGGGLLTAVFDYNDGAGFGSAISSCTLTLTSPASPNGPTAEVTFAVGPRQQPGGTTGFFAAPLLLPGAGNGVGYGRTGAVAGSVGLTTLYDLDTAQSFDTITLQAGFEGGADLVIEHSADLVTWTALPFTLQTSSSYGGSYSGVTLTSDGSGGYTFAAGSGAYATAWYKATVSATSDRFVRVTLIDSAGAGHTSQIGVLSFWTEHGGTILSATPHTFSSAPQGSGGFSLSGYYAWSPAVNFDPDYTQPPTDHPASAITFTAFENTSLYYGTPPFDYIYPPGTPPPVSLTQVTTDSNGAYSYSSGGNLVSLFFAPGVWIPATYDDWTAFWFGPPPAGPCYAVVFFGWTDESALPIADQCVFFRQDPNYPEYASIGAGYRAPTDGTYLSTVYLSGFYGNGTPPIAPPALAGANNASESPQNPIFLPFGEGGALDAGFRPGGVFVSLNAPYFLNGSWTWNLTSSIYANVSAWQKTDSAWKLLNGAAITVADSYGRSETVTSVGITGGDIRTGSGLAPTAANGFFQKINPLAISSVTSITGGSPLAESYAASASGPFANYEISPTLDPNLPHAVGLDSYANNTLRTMYWCLASATSGPATPATQPRADTFHGVLAMTWLDSAGALYVATHPGPLGKIGHGADGWDPVQTLVASGEIGTMLCFLQNGRCYLTTHFNGAMISDYLGRSHWTPLSYNYFAAAGYAISTLSTAGRSEREGWIHDGGSGAFIQAWDQQGTLWESNATDSTVAASYGAAMLNSRYVHAGTDTATLVVNVADGPGFWRTTGGAVTSITNGQCVGLCYTGNVLVGLWWDYVPPSTGTKQFYAFRSYDQGKTWSKDSSLIPASVIPALTVPPALVAIGPYVVAAWVTGSSSPGSPQFAVSADSGKTWS